MTVQELIDELQKVTDKSKKVIYTIYSEDDHEDVEFQRIWELEDSVSLQTI